MSNKVHGNNSYHEMEVKWRISKTIQLTKLSIISYMDATWVQPENIYCTV